MEAHVSRPAELSSIESHLGYWLRYVSNHVSHAFALKLAPLVFVRPGERSGGLLPLYSLFFPSLPRSVPGSCPFA